MSFFFFFNLVINLFPCIIQMLLASRAVFIQSPKCMRYRKKGGRGEKGGRDFSLNLLSFSAVEKLLALCCQSLMKSSVVVGVSNSIRQGFYRIA